MSCSYLYNWITKLTHSWCVLFSVTEYHVTSTYVCLGAWFVKKRLEVGAGGGTMVDEPGRVTADRVKTGRRHRADVHVIHADQSASVAHRGAHLPGCHVTAVYAHMITLILPLPVWRQNEAARRLYLQYTLQFQISHTIISPARKPQQKEKWQNPEGEMVTSVLLSINLLW